MIQESTIRDLVEEKIEGSDLFIIETVVSPSNQIRVVLDADSGLSIDKCVEVSRFIEHNLDRDEEDFTLKVSSSGIDEGLLLPRQYKKNLGRDLKVLKKGEHKKLEATLARADDERIVLEKREKKRVEGRKKKEWVTTKHEFTYDQIEEAKVVVSFK